MKLDSLILNILIFEVTCSQLSEKDITSNSNGGQVYNATRSGEGSLLKTSVILIPLPWVPIWMLFTCIVRLLNAQVVKCTSSHNDFSQQCPPESFVVYAVTSNYISVKQMPVQLLPSLCWSLHFWANNHPSMYHCHILAWLWKGSCCWCRHHLQAVRNLPASISM